MPTSHGFCLYMRGQVLDLVGYLDPIFSPGYDEENDWVMRAQAMGFVAKRANHAFVYHLGSQSFREEKLRLQEANASCPRATASPLCGSSSALSLYARRGVCRARRAGRINRETSGGAGYAASAPHAGRHGHLCDRPGTCPGGHSGDELTMIVRQDERAANLPGRLVSEAGPLPDVDVIHKPAQVFDPADLALLFRTPAHVIITHLDLIAYRAQAVFPNQGAASRYRAAGASRCRPLS